MIEKILGAMDHAIGVSRATLGRRLAGIIGTKGWLWDQAGP